jgi:transcriptional regulator with XRE-family HTH domain
MDMSHVKDERLPKAFRENLRNRMREAGVNQTRLATLLGVTPSYVSHLLTGRRDPGLATLSRLSEVLHCRPSDLLADPVDAMCSSPITFSEISAFSEHRTA